MSKEEHNQRVIEAANFFDLLEARNPKKPRVKSSLVYGTPRKPKAKPILNR